jgi:palmitoyltransferase ZDHHC9/14/18
VCDRCIEKFDHHCPWVGTCIGRRNYQPYLAFIFSASLGCILYIAFSITRLVHLANETNFVHSLRTEWAAAIIVIHCSLALLFVGALSGFHTYLVATNQTTYEYFRSKGAENSFHRSLFNNCFEAICGATSLYKYYSNGQHPTLVNVGRQTALRGSSSHQTESIHQQAGQRLSVTSASLHYDSGRNGESCRQSMFTNALHEDQTEVDDAMLPPLPQHIEVADLHRNARPPFRGARA